MPRIDPTSVPINLLNPRPGTKFGEREYMDPWEAVKWIAIFRLILPDALFRLCGGRVENIGELQQLAVRAGINGVMMGNFLTTLGNTPDEDRAMFENLGLNVARQPDNAANPRPDNRSGWLEGETPAQPAADDIAEAVRRLRGAPLGPLDAAALRAQARPDPTAAGGLAGRRRAGDARLTAVSTIAARLAELRELGLYRRTRLVSGPQGPNVVLDGQPVLLLCSNNYLGLADHTRVQEAAADAALRWGVGAGASRLVSGTMTVHRRLEQRLAAFKGTETALLFGSGYLANLGVVGALSRAGEVIFSDELNHASIIDGCRLSRAETFVYAHNDVEHLAWGLAQAGSRAALIVTESVFSMDGDIAPLEEIAHLARRHGARVVVDEAHATGCIGPGGRGAVAEAGLDGEIDVIIGTLGKALGSYGAFAACDAEIASLLTNSARPLIFSTAPPPPAVAGRDRRARRARGAAAAGRPPAGQQRGAARRARARGLRRRRLGDADHPADRRRPRHGDAHLRGGARARRLRAGDPAADGARRHVAAAPGGDGDALQGRAARGRARARSRRPAGRLQAGERAADRRRAGARRARRPRGAVADTAQTPRHAA